LTRWDAANYLPTFWTTPSFMPAATETDRLSGRLDDADYAAVKTLRKALTILDAFAGSERPLTVAEVAIMTGVTRPTAHRLVQTLVAEGYLSQEVRSGRLAPGYSVLRLAGRLLDADRLRLEAMPHLEDLARKSGARADLAILHRGELLTLGGAEPSPLPAAPRRFGKTAPAYCTSLGKAILAELPAPRLNSYLANHPLLRRTPNTITQQRVLRKELAKVRREGHAIDAEEYAIGIFSVATAVVVDGAPAGAIGITGHALEPLLEHVPAVRQLAAAISHALGS
jgi:DNA-binding IclR family transcriptional regulator